MRPAAAALLLAVLLPLPGLAGEVVVKAGETLSELAERYGTTTERLMQLNGLRSPQDLWAGSRIRVPGPTGSAAGGTSKGGGGGNYTVKPGETLSELAERYGTTTERLMQLNGLRSPQDLWAGSRIQVPGASPAQASTTRPPINRNARQHAVQSGETLSEIADRYGIPMSRLASLNGLSKPDELQVGTTLQLRSAPPIAKPPARVSARPATPPTSKPPASKPAASQPSAKPSAAKPNPAPSTTAKPATPAPSTTEQRPRPAAATATASTAATSSSGTAVATAKPSKPATPDWRSYGPLQVDWANWQPMGGSYVAPSINSDGQPLYLAINCAARRLNATGQSGAWKTWDAPQSEFEEQLINDLCKAKGG